MAPAEGRGRKLRKAAMELRHKQKDDPHMRKQWRCFHCDELFTDREAAADHFGAQIDGLADDTACKLNATDGLIVKMLREAQEELRKYHQEDNAAYREFYALGAKHSTALLEAEQLGYDKGVAEMKAQGYCVEPQAHAA